MTVLCLSLAIACVFDYGRRKIPNLLVLLTAAAGMGRSYVETGPGGMVRFLVCMGAVMFLLYPFFRIGMLGAGDIKLLGVSSGFFQITQILPFLFFSMLIAAIISIVQIVKEQNAGERMQYFCEYCADVIQTGSWKLYFSDKGKACRGICLSGPILCSALLHWGGVY